jgi:hypothetical protein
LTDVFRLVELTVTPNVGRGNESFGEHTAGNIRRAAETLLRAHGVLIVTGFYIDGATQAACETDGPLGAVQLAAAIERLGGQAVVVLTDAPCAPVLRAAAAAAGISLPVDVAPLPTPADPDAFDEWEAAARDRYAGFSHVIAVERPGPDASGVPRTMRGHDMSAYTAPLHRLYSDLNWTRIAVGDGGNELGMAVLSNDLVRAAVPLGSQIWCAVSCDILVAGAVSNWVAAGLVATLALLGRSSSVGTLLEPEWSRTVLSEMLSAGAVDGLLRVRQPSVDGLEWDKYAEPLARLAALVRRGTSHGSVA